MRVVSNTSPLYNLSVVRHDDLLPQLYGRIVIPEAVGDELAQLSAEQSRFADVRSEDWVEVQPVHDRSLVIAMERELHAGEAEAIALAAQSDADLLLMDERMGRRVAARFGVPHMGLLGVLIAAKRQGLVDRVKPVLTRLRSDAGFWMSDALVARVLDTAGE